MFCSLQRFGRTLFYATVLAAVAVSGSGCAQFILLGYLIGGPPSIEPDFDAMTGKSMSDEHIKVVVVCYAPTELKWDFEKIDAELAAFVSYGMSAHHIDVVPTDYVRAWLDENPDWEKAEEIGRAFDADYVVDIELNSFTLYEENSTSLYRGRTEAYVNVFEIDGAGAGTKIYSKEVNSVYPTLAPKATQDVTYIMFKREYLSRLSEEIGYLFFERYNGDKISWAT